MIGLVILSDRRERRISYFTKLSSLGIQTFLRVQPDALNLGFAQNEILRFAQDDKQAKGSG